MWRFLQDVIADDEFWKDVEMCHQLKTVIQCRLKTFADAVDEEALGDGSLGRRFNRGGSLKETRQRQLAGARKGSA